jgi:S1-C subfamily serine protease
MMAEKQLAKVLTLVVAACLLLACGGEAAAPAGVDGGETSAGPAPEESVQQPATTPAPAVPRASRTPPAPYYFSHARFVLARDDQGNPLGLRVEQVLPGGRVALAGIQVGDLIHAIDGVPMDDPASFDRAVRMAEDIFRDRRPQHFVVTRQGRKVGLVPLGAIETQPAPSPQP